MMGLYAIFLFVFFLPSQNSKQNSDMTVVAFYDLLITCYVSGSVLYAGGKKVNERVVLWELVFYDWLDQPEFLVAKNKTILPSLSGNAIYGRMLITAQNCWET